MAEDAGAFKGDFKDMKKYDLAFGIGVSCNSSISLRRANMQYLSFPGDWLAPLWKREELPSPNLVYRTEWLCRGLDGFFNLEDFKFVRRHEWNGKDVYANERTHYLFVHDIPAGSDLSDEFPKMVAKYERRYARLVSLIKASRNVLVLRLDHADGSFPASVEDCAESHRRLCETFPGVSFDFVFFQCDPSRTFENRLVERVHPWLTRVAFAYHDKKHPEDKKLPDNFLIAKALKRLAKVRDYRTKEERAAHDGAKPHGALGWLRALFGRR